MPKIQDQQHVNQQEKEVISFIDIHVKIRQASKR